jgi:branched-chain amino acid transport system ATP-binding protein
MLKVNSLNQYYGGSHILRDLSFEVPAGKVTALLGRNGVGKTTLLRTLMGFVPAQRGRITFDEIDITREPPYARARRGLGYVPQGREIFPGLSVRDNLRMGFAGRGAEERLDAILALFPRLSPLLQRRGGALSGGEQQLLAIARCLAGQPKMILFDEPTEGIQPSIIEELVVVLRQLHQSQGLTILLVEQNLEFIAELAQRVLLIQKGTILRELQPAELRHADVLSEFVGVATEAEASPGRAMRQG